MSLLFLRVQSRYKRHTSQPLSTVFLREECTRLLIRAAVLGHRDVVATLLQHGAMPDESVWDATEKSGQRHVLALLHCFHAYQMVCCSDTHCSASPRS